MINCQRFSIKFDYMSLYAGLVLFFLWKNDATLDNQCSATRSALIDFRLLFRIHGGSKGQLRYVAVEPRKNLHCIDVLMQWYTDAKFAALVPLN